jgi:hypothetical protein
MIMTLQSVMSKSKRNFLLTGGSAGIGSAAVGSLVAILFLVGFIELREFWQSGTFENSLISSFGLGSSLIFLALLVFLGFVFSILPSFIGGVLLAWFMGAQDFQSPPTRNLLGWLIGALSGIFVSVLVFIPYDWLGRNSHNPYDSADSINGILYFATFIIVISAAAGAWTQHRLQTQFSENAQNKAG